MKNGLTLVLAAVVVLAVPWSVEAEAPPQLTAGADTPVQLNFDSPKSVREIYSEIGELTGVTVHFDPRFKDSKISVEIDTASAAEAFDAIAEAAGYFWVPIEAAAIAVAEDTPQNRRELTPLVIQVFPLKYAEVRDADRLLRSLVEVRRLAPVEALGLVAVRDTADKMIVIKHLIDLIDRSPGQVDFAVDVISYRDSKKRPEAPARMVVDAYRALRSNGSFEVLGQGGLVALGQKSGSLSVMVPMADQTSARLTVEISAQSAQVDGQETATVDAAIVFGPDGALKASAELHQGETWLIPWPHPNRTRDLALAVTAITIEPPEFNPADLEPYWVGTESRIAVPRP